MSHDPLVIAHRGASRRAPENTVAAFVLARELGADGVELDARRTADDVLVVHHDPQVPEFGLIRDATFAALRDAHPEIPTLRDAIDACGDMIVNVEIKCLPWEPDADDARRSVVHAVADMVRDRADHVIVSSFDLGSVDACRSYAPGLTTALLTHGQDLLTGSLPAPAGGHQWLHPDRLSALRASAEVVADVHERGLRIDVWTVDDPTDV